MPKTDLTLITQQQAAEIKKDIESMERMFVNDQRSKSPKIQDVAEFRSEIDKKRKILEAHTPKPLRGKEKDKAWKRVLELDALIKEHMPRKKDFELKYPKGSGCDMDFERAVRQQIAFETNSKIKDAVSERKYWMGRLEPHDPFVRNIESLRK